MSPVLVSDSLWDGLKKLVAKIFRGPLLGAWPKRLREPKLRYATDKSRTYGLAFGAEILLTVVK